MKLTAHWRYSGRCNFKCNFCFGLPETKFKRNKIDEHLILDDLIDSGFTHLVFGGDEPLMRKEEVLNLIEYATSKGLACSLDTNGSNLDDSTIKVLQKNNVLVGLPIYSSDPKIHNSMVGQNNHYNLIISLLKKVKENSISGRLQTAVTAKNLDNIIDIGDIVNKYSVLYWNLIKFRAYKRALLYKQEYSITDREFYSKINEIKNKYPSINIVSRGGEDDRKCAYFIIRKDGTVVSPVENGREIVLGDLVIESAGDVLKRINLVQNTKKTIIESVNHKGDI